MGYPKVRYNTPLGYPREEYKPLGYPMEEYKPLGYPRVKYYTLWDTLR